MKLTAIFLNFFLISRLWGTEVHCRGTDGPTPFTVVPPPNQELIKTTDSITSFVILEKKNQLAYVGSKGHLWLYDLQNQSELNLGKFRGPLASLVDPDERFLVSGKAGLVKDLRTYKDTTELRIPNSADPVFWYQKELFLLDKVSRGSGGNWNVSFARVNSDYGTQVRHSCQFSLAKNIEVGVGQGHVFPFLFLYGFRQQKGGSHVDLYFVNLISQSKNCDIRLIAHYRDPIHGKIVKVTQLNDARDYAIQTDQDQNNLLYDQGNTCRYFNIPSGTSYFPNPGIPVLLNLNRQKGAGVFALESGKYFTIDRTVNLELTLKSHVWINSSSPDMYMVFKDKGNNFRRRLYHLGLESILGN
ncbi:MAG: hypothetical protein EB078_01940 [Proteobacteria bacterium]|nr:hypothetical protein [Pseudomonadota bacterium]NDC23463.1 hypothetical protein [Pseudomonadota bacterium]NDD03642.1 hypothetical protein [Pseudomonadota bacterium]NDG26067.1 hypothetical protein [Pseudomonadota bacterium]